MNEKTKQASGTATSTPVGDHELRAVMEEYLQEENKNDSSIWNFATVSGLAMAFVAMSVFTQNILESTLGFSFGPDLSSALNVLPVAGGVLVLLVGFGLIAGERSKKKKSRSKQPDISGEMPRFETATASASEEYEERDRLDAFLNRGRFSNKKSGNRSNVKTGFDDYALRQNRSLFKSRTDKKLAGVCGGLAKYFCVSSTLVRLVFVVAALLGYGSFFLVYIVMMLIVPKEPVELMDDF
ncbi:MAG: PspC domain-containing protein [Balneolaceae bacterium]